MPDRQIPFEYEVYVAPDVERRVAAKKQKVKDSREEYEHYHFLLTHKAKPFSIAWFLFKWEMAEACVRLAWAQRDLLDEALDMPPINTTKITKAERIAAGLPRCRSLPSLLLPNKI